MRALALLLSLILGAPAIAAPRPVDRGKARKVEEALRAMERGVKALSAGRPEDALVEFDRASELVPDADKPHRRAADTLEQLGRHAEAIERLRKYLALKPDARDAERIRARMEELTARYLEGRLDVLCTPDGAEVQIDEAAEPAGKTPLRGFRLPAGEHRVRVRSDGYQDIASMERIVAGTTVVLRCELKPPPPPPEKLMPQPVAPQPLPARPAEPPPPAGPAWYTRWWLWTAVGVAAAAATTYVIVDRRSLPDTRGGTYTFPGDR